MAQPRLTTEETKDIIELYESGTSCAEIAELYGRKYGTVWALLKRHNLLENDSPKKSQNTKEKESPKTAPSFDARRTALVESKTKTTNVRRGDVFFVCKSFEEAEVMAAGRPAVIVSNDRINMCCDFVEIVFLTTKDKKPQNTHVTITATGTQATALCEEIMSIRKNRLRDYCNTCSPEEMAMIDKAMAISLALDVNNLSESVNAINPEPKVVCEPNADYQAIVAEKDLYKRMYEELLDKLVRR